MTDNHNWRLATLNMTMLFGRIHFWGFFFWALGFLSYKFSLVAVNVQLLKELCNSHNIDPTKTWPSRPKWVNLCSTGVAAVLVNYWFQRRADQSISTYVLYIVFQPMKSTYTLLCIYADERMSTLVQVMAWSR